MTPPPTTLSDVRAACAYAAAVAAPVPVVGDLEAYARTFDLAAVERPTYDEAHHFRGTEEETVAYVVALDAVNFGSGWFPKLRKRAGMSGYFTVASRLTDHVREHGPLPAERLATIEASDVAAIFAQPLDDPDVVELMEHFAEAWRQLGALLLGRFDGSPQRLVAAAEHRAERLVELLASMPYFRDVATYRGRSVPLYKRAQITASDLDLALGGAGLGRFDDLDRLTIFADNLVPHVLRVDGMIAYDEDLAARIERGELLLAGSPQEVEIRAVAVDAVERMVVALQGEGRPITARAIDVALWNRGQGERYRSTPRHRTRTVFY